MKQSDMQQFFEYLPRPLIERWLDHADMMIAFYQDAAATERYDRARLRDCLEDYGRLRIDTLTHFGLDPASEEFMPLPAQLLDA